MQNVNFYISFVDIFSERDIFLSVISSLSISKLLIFLIPSYNVDWSEKKANEYTSCAHIQMQEKELNRNTKSASFYLLSVTVIPISTNTYFSAKKSSDRNKKYISVNSSLSSIKPYINKREEKDPLEFCIVGTLLQGVSKYIFDTLRKKNLYFPFSYCNDSQMKRK